MPQMIRWLRQMWCGHKGHPYPTITIPIGGPRPQDPEADKTYCSNCSAFLWNEFTDNAGTERRDVH